MQAALRDLTPSRVTKPRPFLICQRVLHRCHEIIFGDLPEPNRSPYRSLPHSPQTSTVLLPSSSQPLRLGGTMPAESVSAQQVVRINPHVPPSLVGMGTILAAAAMPGVSDLAGQWAVIQGRKTWDEDGETRARVEVDANGGSDGIPRQRPGAHLRQKSSSSETDDDRPRRATPRTARGQARNPDSPHPSATAPNLAFSPELAQMSTPKDSPRIKGDDPFSQTPAAGPSTPPMNGAAPTRHSPFSSVPEFSSTNGRSSGLRRLHQQDRTPAPENLLATYSLDCQRQLLRSHYCRSQVRFLLLLEDISNRLLVIPKLARVSALRAELTGLNHNLPAEVRRT